MAVPKPPTLTDEMLSHLEVDFCDHEPSSQVASFYANRSVFITGATGFIGKVLVEKLVRSCKDIKKIYLLIREKRGKDVGHRLTDLLQSRIFNRIKSQPDGMKRLQEKLCAIRGDITEAKFGISDSDKSLLAEEVSIVFNSAATIRFSEPIDVAVRNNIFSVGQLVDFCDGLKNLEALIHLSTAYSNCHKRDTIYEVFYDPPMKGEEIIEAVGHLRKISNAIHRYPRITLGGSPEDRRRRQSGSRAGDQHEDPDEIQRDRCEQQSFFKRARYSEPSENDNNNSRENAEENYAAELMDEFAEIALRRTNRPNTYTFTKAISEYYLLELCKQRPNRYLNSKIPVALVRPSIVGSAWREPEPGFVDNFNGATGPIMSVYTGILQAMPGDGFRVADLVPVDMVVNMVISAGWYLVEGERQSASGSSRAAAGGAGIRRDHGAYIFNFVSGYRNPLQWQYLADLLAKLAYKYPSNMLVRLPNAHYFVRAGKVYNLYDYFNHKLVAMFSDFVKGTLMREELTSRTSAVLAYTKIRKMTSTLTPFTTHQWRLCDSNVSALYKRLPTEIDRQLFPFNVESINWADYITKYIIGSRINTLRDEAGNVPHALMKLRK